ncbi:NADH dehydrogenase [ubiquinone] iron-sulfur protein 5 [Condylostylus longicornis]|uniref:NADH dehydrogenase [ubiquinone] iron-sulfur protein 5 n=1 Tax=Condylostylus longicornis TaxID=2530218 RepID=UPI00244E2690|nr:NADH dehydrogenase [ubiquinone] iron-sulfur protein 5 [Condylostylus longicornis]XP_055387548.1 NADH dehydrogenase [ubiquinone] iron-sulfur protein 5 [Condylostylus longicornis]
MASSPFLKTPLTDLTGCVINHQHYDKCGEFEMNMMDCLEAYGLDRGKKKCADLIADFQECAGMRKQMLRYNAMRLERHRQYLTGEVPKSKHYAEPPRTDAY